ncbi:MAG: cycloartenol synthase [Verrucomicrobia bacterium]|nr:cycloartenol synthase [Verrucomicrobiota bacterium]
MNLKLSAKFALATLLAVPAFAADAPKRAPVPVAFGHDESLRHEVQRAIDRGIAWLLANQNSNGWWTTPDHPAVTALPLIALNGEPSGKFLQQPTPQIRRGYAHLLASAKLDGGIYATNMANYNTSLALLALVSANRPEYDAVARRARAFIVGTQVDFGEKGRLDTPFDGGVGYGNKYAHSDLNNTLMALEALHHSKRLVADSQAADAKDLDWQAAIRFLQHCQNLPGSNPESWASADPANKGGFIYYPGHSMAGGVTNSQTGRVALRSYGSASYAGLLSYIYADLKRDDTRVTAVLDWLRANYTLEENPGMGPQGLYYYLHLLTKGLSAAQVWELELKDGRKVNWRREVALRLMNLQQRDGSWENANARWWEKETALTTSYALISLELIWRGL